MTSEQSIKKDLRRQEILQQLAQLYNEEEEPKAESPQLDEVIEDDKPIEKPKKKGGNKTKRTDKQMESLVKGREVRKLNLDKGREKKEQENIIHKQELEKNLIEKAIKVKKKQLKKIEIFDDLSDEDTTPVIQKPKQEKPKVAPVAIQPQIIDPYDVFKKKFNIR